MTTGSGRAEFTKRVLIVLGIAVLAAFAWAILDVILLVFGAALVAIILRAIADPIAARTPLTPLIALGLAVVTLGSLVGLVAWLFGSEVAGQFTELGRRVPQTWGAVREWLSRSELGTLLLDALSGQDAPKVGSIAKALTQGTRMLGEGAVQLLLVVFGGVYLAAQPRVYLRGMLKLVPDGARERVAGAFDTSADALRLWLLGQLVTMAVVGLLTGLGLWALGVPAPFALGLLAGLAEFIPFVGPVLATVPALMVAFATSPQLALWTLLLYVAVQQVESNVLVPLVQRRVLDIPPALAVFAVVALGVALGPLGLVFAAPLTVMLVVLVGRLYVRETLGEPTRVPGEG